MSSKIKTITIANAKAIASFQANLNGCTVIVTAGNNQGKSTLLRTTIDRIRGLKSDNILRNDEKEGFSELELTTGEKFVWTFNDKGKEKLTFVTEKNIPGSVSKDIANSYFPKSFDIDKFLLMAPKDKKAELERISGIDFTELNKLYEDAYKSREYYNRVHKEEKAKAEYVDPKLPTEPIPFEEIEKELNGIEAHNLRYDQAEARSKDYRDKVSENDKEIERLAALIAQLQEKNEELEEKLQQEGLWLFKPENQKKSNQEELKLRLSSIKEQNSAITANNKAIEQQTKIETAEKNAKEADAEVKSLEAEKLDVIKNASMPEGFAFTDDGITYNGYPFDKSSISSSQLYIGALKLAATTLGEVKFLYFDASFLDNASLLEVEKWAQSEGLQLGIEIPEKSGGPLTYELICETL